MICDAHFPEFVPSLDINDEFEDTESNYEAGTEVILEIQCIKEQTFKCDICDKQFITREERNVHIGDHFKTYTCTICNKTLIGDRQFEHHRQSKECVKREPIESTTYECFMCHKGSFFSVRSLRIHVNREHNQKKTDSAQHICKFCQKKFANGYILKSHTKQIHMDGPRFSCADCGKTFNRMSNLQWHQLIHQNELPCVCKICSKPFRTLSGLNLHKRTHTVSKRNHLDLVI